MRFVKGVWWYHSKAETVCSQTSAANIGRLMEPKHVNYITVNQMEVRRCVIDSACFLICFFNAPFQDERLFKKIFWVNSRLLVSSWRVFRDKSFVVPLIVTGPVKPPTTSHGRAGEIRTDNECRTSEVREQSDKTGKGIAEQDRKEIKGKKQKERRGVNNRRQKNRGEYKTTQLEKRKSEEQQQQRSVHGGRGRGLF